MEFMNYLLSKPKEYLLIKVHEEGKPMATCVDFVGYTQPNPKEPAQVNKPNPARGRGLKVGKTALVHP